jgi:TP901 family phage tail tape measure protein
MADRTVKVSLLAQVSGYIDGMDRAARKTRETATAADLLARKGEAFTALGRSALLFGTVVAAGVAVAISKFVEFDRAMSNVNAVTQETTENLDLLRGAALEAGGRTIFTATEAANAIEELGKAGLSTADILSGALDGALDLAASGQLEVARASEIAATTLKQFHLNGSDAAHVADVLSAGAGKALGSVEDLAQGLKFVGPVAASMGVSLEETTGALALFADQGLIGEQAGTSLRGVLASLTSPSSQAAKEIENLGINLYDAQGKFLGLENTAGQLANAYRGLDDKSRDASLGIIFGNQQVTAARVLFDGGAEAVAKYTAEVNDTGYASRVAADRLNNLSGDVEKLGGAFDTALIQSGSAANDILRDLTQSATFLVDGIGGLPEPVLAAGLALAAAAAAAALVGGASLIAIPKIAALKVTMAAAGVSGGQLALRMGGATAALTALSLVIGYVVGKLADQKAQQDALYDSLNKSTGAVTDYTGEVIRKQLAEAKAYEFAKKAGISQDELTDAVMNGGKALDEVSGKLTDYANFGALAAGQNPFEATEAAQSVKRLSKDLDENQKAFADQAAASEEATKANKANEDTLAELRGEAGMAGDEIQGLADIIRGFGSATLSTRDAQRQFQSAIDDATDALAKNGATTDINTEAGRENQAALDAIAKSALEMSASILEETTSQEDATAAIQEGRDAVVAQRIAMGDTQAQAEAYADQLGLIPANVRTAIDLDTTAATNALNAWIQTASGKKVLIQVGGPAYLYSASGGAAHNASGGYTRSGAHLSWLGEEGTEFVSTASTVANPHNRAALEYMHGGGDIRYAPGTQGWGSGGAAPEVNITLESKGGVDLLQYIDVKVESGANAAIKSATSSAKTAMQGR